MLKYNYNLKNPTVYRQNTEIKIKDGQDRYNLIPFKKINELNDIYNLIHNEKIENIYNEIIATTNGNLYCDYQSEKYVLIKIEKEITSIDYIKIKHSVSRGKYRNIDKSNWKVLWQEKKEYYEKLTSKSNNIIHNYYNVMASTAINYLPELLIDSKKFIVTYKRIDNEDLKNPLNIVIDVEERNIAEQIRQDIIKKKLNQNSLEIYIKYCKKNNLDLSKIYARLLFPSYYYDYLDKNKQINMSKDIIVNIIYYENKLKEINKEFNKYQNIKKVDWL